jgi:hypothetical protein
MLCIVTVILAQIFRIGLVLIDSTETAFYFTLSRIDALAIGAYIAVRFRHHGTLTSCKRSAVILFIASEFLCR